MQVMHIWRAVLKDLCDPDSNTFTALPLFSAPRGPARARLRATGGGKPNAAHPRARERLMDSGEIILAEYQMSCKGCRIIPARGY